MVARILCKRDLFVPNENLTPCVVWTTCLFICWNKVK